ncbi:hypothetical protein MK163_02980 [bacterium]|nr:hypothetical protein [bacterium]
MPAIDGEAWDARFEIGRPDHRIDITAAYVREFAEAQQVRARDGVEVVFRGGGHTTELRAERLVLEHKRDRFGLAGGVILTAGDSLEVQADTLVWAGEDERLRIPGSLRVEVAWGWERARNLSSNFAVDSWTLEAVEGHWRSEGGKEVVIRARREESWRVGGVQEITYDSVQVQYDGITLAGARATFAPEGQKLVFASGITGADSLSRFTAARAEVDIAAEQLLARGEVDYREDEIELAAAEVAEDRRAGRLRARGTPAVFVQGARRIAAPILGYARAVRVLTAREGVEFSEGQRRLQAGALRYERDAAVLAVWDEVDLRAPELEGRLTGDSLYFDLDREQGRLVGAPSLRRAGADGDTLSLAAGVLRFELAHRRLEGTGKFALRAEGVALAAARGVYEADSARVLAADGVVLHHRSAARDYRSRLEADSMVVALVDNQVEQIAMPGRVFAQVDSEARRNWIEGLGGRVFMVAGDLERVEIDAEADVTYRHLDQDEVNRFHGQRMTLHFDAGGLRRALVSGNAQLVTRLQEEGGEVAVNEVGGEELEIHFADGSIAEVGIGPDIEGSYYPPEEEP